MFKSRWLLSRDKIERWSAKRQKPLVCWSRKEFAFIVTAAKEEGEQSWFGWERRTKGLEHKTPPSFGKPTFSSWHCIESELGFHSWKALTFPEVKTTLLLRCPCCFFQVFLTGFLGTLVAASRCLSPILLFSNLWMKLPNQPIWQVVLIFGCDRIVVAQYQQKVVFGMWKGMNGRTFSLPFCFLRRPSLSQMPIEEPKNGSLVRQHTFVSRAFKCQETKHCQDDGHGQVEVHFCGSTPSCDKSRSRSDDWMRRKERLWSNRPALSRVSSRLK